MKMFDTWLRTVFGLRNSVPAISVLLRPCAISPSTSRSRSVSSGNADRRGSGMSVKNVSTRRAISGP
ncbi:hypothetical protein BJF79_15730 [Actinomadura sp. CNU-125]|nr:hypothetical protein BJF79_15730 [Actinomadura sp. CNU-125]